MSFFLLTVSYILGWLFPPAFLPIQISLLGTMLVEGYSPWFITFVAVGVSTLSYIPLWYITGYVVKKIQKKDSRDAEKGVVDLIADSKKAEKQNIVYSIIKKSLSSRQYRRFSAFMDTKLGRWLTFLLAIFLCAPIVSDVIAVLLLRGKMSLRLFLVAGFIAKFLTIFPIVFLGNSFVSQLLNSFGVN